MKKAFPYLLLSFALLMVLLPEVVDAQCSMCRAVTESNQQSDDAFTIGNGLNNAIIYLMFMPYILAVVFAYAFYGKQIKAWFRSKMSH
ncbi:hypothetical protein ACFLR1_03270 [Bacteroidota bacterium]